LTAGLGAVHALIERSFRNDFMRVETTCLRPESPGSDRVLTSLVFGRAGAGPKAYLQAGLHADEMPGVLVLQALIPLLEAAETEGRIAGEIRLVPLANPLGASQWLAQ
jgi:predicted deacylase